MRKLEAFDKVVTVDAGPHISTQSFINPFFNMFNLFRTMCAINVVNRLRHFARHCCERNMKNAFVLRNELDEQGQCPREPELEGREALRIRRDSCSKECLFISSGKCFQRRLKGRTFTWSTLWSYWSSLQLQCSHIENILAVRTKKAPGTQRRTTLTVAIFANCSTPRKKTLLSNMRTTPRVTFFFGCFQYAHRSLTF